MAYKEKLEQQDSQRRRKFSTHLDIPDRDVLFRSEVSIPFYYGFITEWTKWNPLP